MARSTLLPERVPWTSAGTSGWTPAWWPFRDSRNWPQFELLDRQRDEDLIRVEEFMDGDTLVIRAEAPDVNPDSDIDISVSGGMLHINVSRQSKRERTDKDVYRSEFRYGSFSRSVLLPRGIDEGDIQATYDKGMLEVRIPIPPSAAARKIAVKQAS